MLAPISPALESGDSGQRAANERARELDLVRRPRERRGARGGGAAGGGAGRAPLVAEVRVLAMPPLLRGAALAAGEPGGNLEPPVPAARRLEEVAADRAHRAELGRRGEPAGLA